MKLRCGKEWVEFEVSMQFSAIRKKLLDEFTILLFVFKLSSFRQVFTTYSFKKVSNSGEQISTFRKKSVSSLFIKLI